MNDYPIRFLAVLPYRAAIPSVSHSQAFGKDYWNTSLILTPQDVLPLGAGFSINTEHRTVAALETRRHFDGTLQEFKHWAAIRQPVDRCCDWLMHRLNTMLVGIKYAYEGTHASPIRPVGYSDLIFYNVVVEGEVIFSRGGVSTFGPAGSPPARAIPKQVANEWRLLVRAVDLVNHGFFAEGLIVAVAMLDDVTQQFVRLKMSGITSVQQEELLRTIERKRLKTYLGPLLKVLTGLAPLDDQELAGELDWLNRKRNDVMHNGDACEYVDACRGLGVTLKFLEYFRTNGMTLDLPSELHFW